MNRSRLVAAAAAAAVVIVPAAASAAWQLSNSASGTVSVASIGAGNTPSGTASGTTVDVSWTRTQLSNGIDAESYTLTDYDAATAGSVRSTKSCSGSGTATVTCQVTSAAAGDHYFTVIPRQGTNWVGTESSRSLKVTVAAVIAITGGNRTTSNATFSGTGSNGADISITVCDQNIFPCAAGHVASTAGKNNPPTGAWQSGNTGTSLVAGTTYYARATQGTTTSAVVTFVYPSTNGNFSVS